MRPSRPTRRTNRRDDEEKRNRKDDERKLKRLKDENLPASTRRQGRSR